MFTFIKLWLLKQSLNYCRWVCHNYFQDLKTAFSFAISGSPFPVHSHKSQIWKHVMFMEKCIYINNIIDKLFYVPPGIHNLHKRQRTNHIHIWNVKADIWHTNKRVLQRCEHGWTANNRVASTFSNQCMLALLHFICHIDHFIEVLISFRATFLVLKISLMQNLVVF